MLSLFYLYNALKIRYNLSKSYYCDYDTIAYPLAQGKIGSGSISLTYNAINDTICTQKVQ